ncbi:MAG: SDR family oxidoreductase [Parcubacteria group bacterium]|nr:SDR family oxidoreductase [Parcubacteria group bacterium]
MINSKALEKFSLEGKVVVITGGVGFLGMQYAQGLSEVGAKIVIWDKRHFWGLNDCFLCSANIGLENHSAITIDVTNEQKVQEAVNRAVSKFKRIDVLINNAAMNPAVGSEESQKQFVPYDEYPIDLFRKEIDVNLVGPMICMKAIIPIMKKQGGGVIVNVASEVSNIAHDHRVYADPENRKYKSPAYTASKTALVGLTRQMAAYLGQYNIRVNAFSPGGVGTDKMPADFVKRFGNANMLGRMAKENEYVAAMMFLCSDASSFMTGANLTIDGGKSAW